MKRLRTPYLSLFLSSSLLFSSCKNEMLDETTNLSFETNSIKEIAKKHLDLVNQLKSLHLNHNSSNALLQQYDDLVFGSYHDFENYLMKKDFHRIDEIVDVTKKIHSNLRNYLGLYNEYSSRESESEIIDIFTNELAHQIEVNNENLLTSRSCESLLRTAQNNCEENYGISVAIVVISGFISFGVGTVIGYAGATALLVKCYNDATKAYLKCKQST